MAGLIPLEEAQQRLLALITPLPIRQVALTDAGDRYLAEPLIALRDHPFADLSAMDGYALGRGDGPWTIIGSIPAECRDPGQVGIDEAARIFTGAPLPKGSARILIQENAERDGDRLIATAPAQPSQWIRPRATDFASGDVLLNRGARLTPARIALAAMGGHGTLPCHDRPTLALIATGSELAAPGETDPERLPSSNSPMLADLLREALVTDLGIAADTLDHTRALLRAGAAHDLIVATGGASVGDHDLVKPALEAEGWTIALHRIAMKPGKPLIVAHRDNRLFLGLPGNPVSAFVTALLFALPALRALSGAADPLPHHHWFPLSAPLPAGGNRVEYLRGRRTDRGVEAIGRQDSAALATLAAADVLIRLDIDAPPLDSGDWVRALSIA